MCHKIEWIFDCRFKCRNNGLNPVQTPAVDFVIQNETVSIQRVATYFYWVWLYNNKYRKSILHLTETLHHRYLISQCAQDNICMGIILSLEQINLLPQNTWVDVIVVCLSGAGVNEIPYTRKFSQYVNFIDFAFNIATVKI